METPKLNFIFTVILICLFNIIDLPDLKAQSSCSWSPGGTNPVVWISNSNSYPYDDNWQNPNNWSTGSVPTNSSRVYIPGGCTNNPRIYGGCPDNSHPECGTGLGGDYPRANCYAIEIRSTSGAELVFNSNSAVLRVHESW